MLTPHSPVRYQDTVPPTFPSEWNPSKMDWETQGRWYDHFVVRGAHPRQVFGALLDNELYNDTHVQVALSILNRHGLIAGATGTGKTKTLQLMAGQLSKAGVPCFVADIKGDVTGMAEKRVSVRKAYTHEPYRPRQHLVGMLLRKAREPMRFL